jgi:ParB/RepB/Spo0J family partition protein
MQRFTVKIHQLVVNASINPRHATDDDVSDLVAQIRSNGFTDALWVRATGDGGETFEVIDGSRRLRALQTLNWTDDVPVDVIVADDARARELALGANLARSDLSPADEAVAFYGLKLSGLSVDDIAAHFAVPAKRVNQRIAIGSLPDPIISALRCGDIEVGDAEAFTITTTAERQLAVFEDLRKQQRLHRHIIRQALTEKTVDADGMKAKFVGIAAYVSAGGAVAEDLFSEEAFLLNPDLLDQLFADKLQATAQALKDEGWSWVKVLDGAAANSTHKYEKEPPRAKRNLTEGEKQALATARAQQKAYADELDSLDQLDNPNADQEARSAELVETLAALDDTVATLTATKFTANQKARLGAIIQVAAYSYDTTQGTVNLLLGCNLPGKKADVERDDQDAAPAAEDDTPVPAPVVTEQAGYSDAVEDLLRNAAMAATKLAMVRNTPAMTARMGLAARVCAVLLRQYTTPFLMGHLDENGGAEFEDLCAAAAAPFEHAENFAAVLAVLETMDAEALVKLDALIAARLFFVNALKNTDAQFIINQVDPDMTAEGFRPDEAFFSRLSRDQLLLISAEIAPDSPIKKAPKPAMLDALLPQVAASLWLPPQLRTPRYEGPGSAAWQNRLAATCRTRGCMMECILALTSDAAVAAIVSFLAVAAGVPLVGAFLSRHRRRSPDSTFSLRVGDTVELMGFDEDGCIVPDGLYTVSRVNPDGSFHVGGNTAVGQHRIAKHIRN